MKNRFIYDFNILITSLMAGFVYVNAVSAENITVLKIQTPLVIDGLYKDWKNIPAVTISLKKIKPDSITSVNKARIKVAATNDDVFFYIEWSDPTKNIQHKPWVWDKNKEKYVRGPQREDRVALQFAMRGDYTSNWFSGNDFTADMWHWKASRSNPLGLAHDKSTIISQSKLLRASKYKGDNGKNIYISRPSDQGDKLYKTKRYRKYINDMLPKYIMAKDPKGSATDVKAKGMWYKGKWHVEFSRKKNTSNDDDVIFPKIGAVIGGIAIFNQSDNDDHVYSSDIKFLFK